jgi:hypothetical protein
MTITTSGSLLYGHDLGGGDKPWQLTTADTADGPGLDWYDPAAAHADSANFADFADQAHRHLLAAIGVHTDPERDGYELSELAAEHAGVQITRYSWEAVPSFVLTAHVTTAFYDTPTAVALLDLDRRRTAEHWDERLTTAARHLGLAPRSPSPQWLLTSAP